MEACKLCGRYFDRIYLTPTTVNGKTQLLCNQCFLDCDMCDFCYKYALVAQYQSANGFTYNVCRDCEKTEKSALDNMVKIRDFPKIERVESKAARPGKKYIVIGKNPME